MVQKWSSKLGISCSSFSVKELDVIVHENYFPSITMLNFGRSAKLVVEVGTKHSHQMLLNNLHIQICCKK